MKHNIKQITPYLPHSKGSMAKSMKEKRWIIYDNLGHKHGPSIELHQ